jgi:hypothetical protein
MILPKLCSCGSVFSTVVGGGQGVSHRHFLLAQRPMRNANLCFRQSGCRAVLGDGAQKFNEAIWTRQGK